MNRIQTFVTIFAALFLGGGMIGPTFGFDPKYECWRDYPSIPMREMNYEVVFARETLAPDKITIDGRILKKGLTERNIIDILGMSGASSDWMKRDAQGQCEYLLELLQKNPNSMHLYILGDIKYKKLEGLFRTSEWQLSNVGTLRAFLFKWTEHSTEGVYLFQLALNPVPPSQIKRVKGELNRLARVGEPRVQWNIDNNQVFIKGFFTQKSGSLHNKP